MDSHNRKKINHLIKIWPKGTVAVQVWLNELGIYRQLATQYVKSRWINRLGRGAYVYEGDKVDWTGAIYAIQSQLHSNIHIGGKTALQLQGYSRFVQLGQDITITIFGDTTAKLPLWFKDYNWGVKIKYITSKLFSKTALTKKEIKDYSIVLSTPERAIMEVLYLVPKKETFEEAKLLMEILTNLRPHILQKLLEECTSIKVKRLFMYLAEKYKYSWIKKIDISKIYLGKGKRVIVKGGSLDTKYNIIVEKNDEK